MSHPCCGALQAHAGLADRDPSARPADDGDLAATTADPRRLGRLRCGDEGLRPSARHAEAEAFSARVFDIQEWLADHVDRLPDVEPLDLRVAVQDPCHLRHVQRVHLATRTVLAPFVRELVELDDDGLCCGAGGAYSVLEPELAGQIRDRKVAAIDRTAPTWSPAPTPAVRCTLAGAGDRDRAVRSCLVRLAPFGAPPRALVRLIPAVVAVPVGSPSSGVGPRRPDGGGGPGRRPVPTSPCYEMHGRPAESCCRRAQRSEPDPRRVEPCSTRSSRIHGVTGRSTPPPAAAPTGPTAREQTFVGSAAESSRCASGRAAAATSLARLVLGVRSGLASLHRVGRDRLRFATPGG